jgi:outer membrane protein assembly factor BamB
MKRLLGAAVAGLALLGCDRGPKVAPVALAAPGPGAIQAGVPAGEWPTYHGGFGLTGVSSGKVPDAPRKLWRYDVGGHVEFTPVSAGNRIYVSSSKGGLHALDFSGNGVWKMDLGKEKAFSSPLLAADGLIIAGSHGGALLAFDAATGKETWSYNLDGTVQGTPNRVDLPGGKKGVVVISQGDGCIHAVELSTGKLVWKTDPVERCDGSAGVGNGLIVMGSCASALHLFSIEKGVKQGDVPLGGECQVAGGVALSGTTAFAGSRAGKFFAVDTTGDPKILWANEDAKREAFTTPAVTEAMVVFGSDDGKLYGLDRKTGKKVWELESKESPKSPVVAGNRVAASFGGDLVLLDLETGKKLWSEKVGDEITSPAIVGGMILVGSDDGTVRAFGP